MNETTPTPYAVARLSGSPEYPQLYGTMTFHPYRDGVLIAAEVFELPISGPNGNIFGFHIHEGATCRGTSTDPLGDTGGHYNPEGLQHPYHAGDLPPLFSGDGYAYLAVYTDRVTLDEIIGRVVVIHSGSDDFTTQPSGNSGSKIACGMIRPEKIGP